MSFVKVGEWENWYLFTFFILYTFMSMSIFQYFDLLCLFFLCEWIKLRNINLRFIAWLWLVQLHCCWEYHILSLYLWNEMGCFMFSISNSWSQCYKCCKPRCFCIVLKNDKISRIFDRLKKKIWICSYLIYVDNGNATFFRLKIYFQ